MSNRKTSFTKGALSLRGSNPEMTPIEAGNMGPHSASPIPSLILENARWTGLVTRSARLVVATDMLVGCFPPPAMHPSRMCTLIRRKLPAFVGTGSSMLLKIPIMAPVRAQASLRLSPHGITSGLSRRSTSIMAFSGSTFTSTLILIPSGGVPGTGSWVLVAVALPLGVFLIAAIMSFSL